MLQYCTVGVGCSGIGTAVLRWYRQLYSCIPRKSHIINADAHRVAAAPDMRRRRTRVEQANTCIDTATANDLIDPLTH